MQTNIAKPDLTRQYLPLPRTELMQEVVRCLKTDGRPVYQIAVLAGVSWLTLSKWLDGSTVNGRLSTIESVMTVLGYRLTIVPAARKSGSYH